MKKIIITIVILAIGVGGYFIYDEISKIKKENAMIKKEQGEWQQDLQNLRWKRLHPVWKDPYPVYESHGHDLYP